ncbi:conserved hypothetical protein [Bradyrhizobium sp. ORS 375]|uniref:DUF1127 domain-containing protein n=1 Tax=Bradyrhizobium sp. (strain ORS 375) TaxID=566679 RepID=UPI0002405824|nr:DUF1127 domain-containing protein [Bradyrhizobium sp. ORS 375]CCD92974.1 conserved hypothetical protein [Bradyrhizobium sp. ORS 375]
MFITAVFDVLKRYVHYRTQLAYVDQLDERTLRDIGFTRDQLHAEAWERAALVRA